MKCKSTPLAVDLYTFSTMFLLWFASKVIATAMDPSSASYSATDSDDVRLTRALRLDLHMTSTYVTGVDDTGTIDFVFEVRRLRHRRH